MGGLHLSPPPRTKMQRICTPTARKPERPNQGGASDPNMGEGCESTFWSNTFKLIPSWFSNSPVGIPWASTGCTGCRGLVRASLNRGAPHAGPPPGCPWTLSPSSPPPSAGGPQASCPPPSLLFSQPNGMLFLERIVAKYKHRYNRLPYILHRRAKIQH